MQHILEAITATDRPSPERFAALEIPESYRAITLHKEDVGMFEGMESR